MGCTNKQMQKSIKGYKILHYITISAAVLSTVLHSPSNCNCKLSLIKTRPLLGRHQDCLLTPVCCSLHNTTSQRESQRDGVGKFKKKKSSIVWLQFVIFSCNLILEDSSKSQNSVIYYRFSLPLLHMIQKLCNYILESRRWQSYYGLVQWEVVHLWW